MCIRDRGIPSEIAQSASRERYRVFDLRTGGQTERYYFSYCRRLGANKLFIVGQTEPAIRFSVWAPNAQAVELVLGCLLYTSRCV